MDALLAVTGVLTDAERQAIVDRFTAVNPHWEGAEAADILDALEQGDADLAKIEPFYDAHDGDLPDDPCAGYAVRAVVAMGRDLTVPAVHSILGRGHLAGITADFYYTVPVNPFPRLAAFGPMTEAEAAAGMDSVEQAAPGKPMQLLRLVRDYLPPAGPEPAKEARQ